MTKITTALLAAVCAFGVSAPAFALNYTPAPAQFRQERVHAAPQIPGQAHAIRTANYVFSATPANQRYPDSVGG